MNKSNATGVKCGDGLGHIVMGGGEEGVGTQMSNNTVQCLTFLGFIQACACTVVYMYIQFCGTPGVGPGHIYNGGGWELYN